MALTEEQKKEADKLGMTYELYEALSNITIDPNALSGLSETLAQINSPAGQADLSAAIAANIGPINPLTMLGLDSGPVFKPLTFIDAAGNPVVVNQNNPTNIPQTFKALQDLEIPKVADVIIPQSPATKKRVDRQEIIVPNPNSQYEISFGYQIALFNLLENLGYKHIHFFGWEEGCKIENVYNFVNEKFLNDSFQKYTNTNINEHPNLQAHIEWSKYLFDNFISGECNQIAFAMAMKLTEPKKEKDFSN